MQLLQINIYYWLILGLASLVFCGLAGATCFNAIRLRNKRMSWRSGTLKGFPLFSAVFLLFTLALLPLTWKWGNVDEKLFSLLYLMIGFNWFMVSYLTSKRYITDHGIVKNVNDPSQTVAWHQIRDFFEQPDDNNKDVHFVFIYSDQQLDVDSQLVRLHIKIPSEKTDSFRNLISHKLGRRISCYKHSTVEVEQFKID